MKPHHKPGASPDLGPQIAAADHRGSSSKVVRQNRESSRLDSSEKNMVAESLSSCATAASAANSGASGYARVQRSRLISSAEISRLFSKPDYWFSRDRNRKALGLRGFPRPVIRGRWLRTAVEAWLEREGHPTAEELGGHYPSGRFRK
ncbi:MAG TPA: hypothetical protein VGJ56_29385 [Reyranella sp.]|jgi:hypothetical protein